VFRRVRGDRVALGAGIALALLVALITVGEPLLERLVGHGEHDVFPYAVEQGTNRPLGPWSSVPDVHEKRFDANGAGLPAAPGTSETLLVFGGDGPLGRDLFLRVLIGGRTSLLIAVGGALIALGLGSVLGGIAGYFGGWVDAVIERLIESMAAFPLLLLVIVLGQTSFADRLDDVTLGGRLGQGVVTVMLLVGFFTWFYAARVVRAEFIRLREREFVEAARMLGASDGRIMRSHLLPHVLPTLATIGLISLGTNVVLEAGITFFGFGVTPPTVSWGTLISETWSGTVFGQAGSGAPGSATTNTVWLTLFPCLAIFLTVPLANLLADALREPTESVVP
jgi:peptide/nickel transport system permease protein